MAKYQVDVSYYRNYSTTTTSVYVDAESDYVAREIALDKVKAQHRSHPETKFSVAKIKKIG